MKKLIALTIILIAFAGIVWAGEPAVKSAYDMPVKKLYSAPSEDSSLVLDIPIEVKLLDISEDGNWYKVKIAYAVGPFSYTYVGWSNIPVGSILAEREKNASKIAAMRERPGLF
jgi:hypothetical protein